MNKITIEIPLSSLFGKISKQHTQELIDSLNNDYDNKYNFLVNINSDEYIYDKYDDDRKAYIIFLNVKKYSRVKAEQVIWEKVQLLKDIKSEMVFVVSDKDIVESLSNNKDLSEIEDIMNSKKFKNIK